MASSVPGRGSSPRSDESGGDSFGPLRGLPPKLGRYKPLTTLEAEGEVSVHLALQEDPGGNRRLVVLKCPRREAPGGEQFLRTFLDEARLARQLQHRALCPVVGVGEVGGVAYIATELILGERLDAVMASLRDREELPGGRRRWAYAAKIIADVAEGLQEGHELRRADGAPAGLLHRELSPKKIFISYDGDTQVIDLGLALSGEALTERTDPEPAALAYLAPEQLYGSTEGISCQADVWAAGVILWELVTGGRLFLRDEAETTAEAVRAAPIPPLSELVPKIPPRLDAIVTRALERDRARRYPTAKALSRDLVALLGWAGHPLSVTEVGDLMETLFPGRREQRSLQLQKLSGLSPAPAPRRSASPNPAPPASSSTAPVSRGAPTPPGDDDFDSLPTVMRPAPSLTTNDEASTKPRPAPSLTTDDEASTKPRPAPSLTTDDEASTKPRPAHRSSAPAREERREPHFQSSPPGDYGELVPPVNVRVRPLPPSGRGRRRLGLAGLGLLVILVCGVGLGIVFSRLLGPEPEAGSEQLTGAAPHLADRPLERPPDADELDLGLDAALSSPLIDGAPSLDAAENVDAAEVVDGGEAFIIDAAPDAEGADQSDAEADADQSDAETRVTSTKTIATTPRPPKSRGTRPHRTPTKSQPEPSSPAEPGTVNVVTPGGWADIYLGSSRMGRSPTRFELPAGRHRLRLLPFGREPAKVVPVRVEPGTSSRISVRLDEEQP